MIMKETANLYGISEQSLYRALAQRARPRALRRSDRGTPRVLPQDKMEYCCELIAEAYRGRVELDGVVRIQIGPEQGGRSPDAPIRFYFRDGPIVNTDKCEVKLCLGCGRRESIVRK
jgi:hypothetical protein